MTINIFAEHLININTVRVQVTLPTDQGQARARLSPGGTEIVVSHGEESASLRLPVRLIGKQEELQVPASPTTVLNYRFSIRPAITSSLDSAKTANVVPWTASQLAATSAAYCSSCGCNLLAAGKIKAWKDLPSEGWAEMMEFWHCHKPAEPELPSGQTRKGYSSTSRLDLKPGTGYVAPTSFLLMLQDLHNTEVSRLSLIGGAECWAQKNRCFEDLHGRQRDTLCPRSRSNACVHVSPSCKRWEDLTQASDLAISPPCLEVQGIAGLGRETRIPPFDLVLMSSADTHDSHRAMRHSPASNVRALLAV